jgi:hypothetical protein
MSVDPRALLLSSGEAVVNERTRSVLVQSPAAVAVDAGDAVASNWRVFRLLELAEGHERGFGLSARAVRLT